MQQNPNKLCSWSRIVSLSYKYPALHKQLIPKIRVEEGRIRKKNKRQGAKTHANFTMVWPSLKCFPKSTLELANLAWSLFQLLPTFARVYHQGDKPRLLLYSNGVAVQQNLNYHRVIAHRYMNFNTNACSSPCSLAFYRRSTTPLSFWLSHMLKRWI
jgi:hypothetical protein